MTRLPTLLCSTTLTFLLAACGGSDDDGPPISSRTIRGDIGQLIGPATVEIKVETNGDEVALWAGPYESHENLDSLEFGSEETPETYRHLGIRHGVSRARTQEVTYRPYPNEVLSYLNYAGWMDHSLFFVSKVRFMDTSDGFEQLETFNHSLGNASRTNPVSGGASWKGVMAGFDISDTATEGNLIEGDATVTIDDFSQPAVDVALTALRDRSTGSNRPSMIWNGVPVSGGVFWSAGVESDPPAESGIMGQFYGPDHEEVGGVFVRNQISGAFGAKRQ